MATPTATPERSPGTENGPEPLRQGLKNVARRMRLLRRVRFAARGVILGSLVSLALLVLSRFGLLPVFFDLILPLAIAATYVLSIGAALLLASVQTISQLALARYVEQQLDLKERLSTALTLENQFGDVLVRLQRDDASRFADRIEPRVLIPWRLTWELPAAAVSVLLVLLAAFLPASPLSVATPDKIARAETAREGGRLEAVARQVLSQSDKAAPPPVKDAARHLQKVARAMRSHQATRAQAVHELQELSDQIKKANQKAAGVPPTGTHPSGPDKSAQARMAAQRELDRALNAGAPGSDRKGAGNSAQSNGTGKSAGTGAKPSRTQSIGKGNQSAPSGHGSSAAGSSSATSQTAHATGASRKNVVGSHSQSGAQNGKTGSTGKTGASSKTSPSAQPSSKAGSVAAKPQQVAQAQGGSQKAGAAPKTGKDFGKSAPPADQSKPARAATQGDFLGDRLRQYADKIAQRPMASGEREQAAQSLDQLNKKLDDAKMPETQKHVQAAAQALREGRQQDAVSELRQAADAADRETPTTEQKTSGQSSSSSSGGGQGSPQNGAAQQMQRAVDQSKRNLSGQGGQPGQGKQPGQGQGSGPQGNGPGSGKMNPPGNGQAQKQDAHGSGGTGPGGTRNAASHPASGKFPLNGGSTTVVLKPSGPGGRMIEKPIPGKETPGSVPSTVPYYHITPQFKKAAEKDAGAENIPPAYRQQVKKYFDSLTPGQK